MSVAFTLLLGLGLPISGPWSIQESGTKARFRGVSAVSPQVAWASGSQGTVVRTTDGGATWKKLDLPDSAGLDFRDIQAFDDRRAFVLAIGPGELSRIYKTADGGRSWSRSYLNRDPEGFLDAIAFRDADRGLALGDPIDGRYLILATEDGGKTWEKVADAGMPEALPGEGAFAASGTCLVVEGKSNAWFGTGGGSTARVFRSTDGGRNWTVAKTPIRSGTPSSGVFGLAFRDAKNGLAVGGDYKLEDDPGGNLAVTSDGGLTWTPAEARRPTGFRSAVAFLPGRKVIAVGPSGTDLSGDDGATWSRLGPVGFHAFGFAGSGWGVGESGRIGKLIE